MTIVLPPAMTARAVRRVFGFDYRGFSAWVQACIDDAGASAAERITLDINRAMASIERGFARSGWMIVETLGDGAIALAEDGHDADPAGLDAVVTAAGLGLAFRWAATQGPVARVLLSDRLPLWTGAGVELCHAAMREGAEGRGGAVTPSTSHLPERLLVDGEIVRETVGFLCLRGLVESPARIDQAARMADALAASHDGTLEKATQDDKGTLLRAHFAQPRRAIAWARDLDAALGETAALDYGIGLAEGLLYRSVSTRDNEAPAVHGIAVNRAAKLAGAARGLAPLPELADRASRPRPLATASATVGRGCEQARLAALLAGPRVTVDIVAEPGLGKSHLIASLNGLSEAPVAVAACRALALYEPYGLLRQWLDAIGDAEARGAAAPRLPSGEAEFVAWGDEIVAQLRTCIARRAVALVADDVQWADAESLARIESLAPHAHIVLARRPGGVVPRADHQIVLDPLDPAAIATLLGSAGRDDSLVRLSGGNPFHALQLASALGEAIDLSKVEDATAVVDARLRALDRIDRALLRLCAVLGRPLTSAMLAEFASRSGVAIPAARLNHLVERQLLRSMDRSDSFTIVHQLLADRVSATLPPSLVPRLHHHAARLLSRMRGGGQAVGLEEIAAHWEQAGSAARATLLFGKAGLGALAAGAYRGAMVFLDRAATLAASTPAAADRRALWLASGALAAWGQGQVRNAAIAVRSADSEMRNLPRQNTPQARHRRAVTRLRLSVARAEVAQFRGDPAGIVRGNLGAIRWGRVDDGRSAARARGLAFVATTLATMRLHPVSRLAFRLAHRNADGGRGSAFLHGGQAVVALGFGRWAAVDLHLEDAGMALARDPEPLLEEVLLTLAALRAHLVGRTEHARTLFADVSHRGAARGNALMDAWGRYGTGMAVLADGDAAAALATIDAGRTLFDGLGDLQSELICEGMRAHALALIGHADEALAACRSALTLARQVHPTNFGSLEGFSGPALALARLAAGDGALAEEARALFPQARRALASYALMFPIGRARLAFASAMFAGKADGMNAARRRALALGMEADAHAMANDGFWRKASP